MWGSDCQGVLLPNCHVTSCIQCPTPFLITHLTPPYNQHQAWDHFYITPMPDTSVGCAHHSATHTSLTHRLPSHVASHHSIINISLHHSAFHSPSRPVSVSATFNEQQYTCLHSWLSSLLIPGGFIATTLEPAVVKILVMLG